MNLDLKGKNALVCGGSRGIGKASAYALAHLGANITLMARSAEKMVSIIHDLPRTSGQDHDFLVADYADREDVHRKTSTLVSGKWIHILVNNTGGPPGGLISDAIPAEFMDAFEKHIIINQILVREVLPGMIKANYGRIINIISTSVKEPINGLGVSNTIRGAVGNWAKTLANEVGIHGITVNNILPGFTATERLQSIIESRVKKSGMSEVQVTEIMKSQVPLGRFASAGEIANAVAFLASPAASYISGINLPVDGGRTKSL